jgi:tetratricopeptide (TPR) repeat protein
MSRSVRPCIAAFGALLLSGCATMIEVQAVHPPRFNMGTVKKFQLVQLEGPEKGRDALLALFKKSSAEGGTFTLVDRRSDGITLQAAGNTLQLNGLKQPLADDEVLLRVDILEWTAGKKENPEAVTDSKAPSQEPRHIVEAKTRVKVTLSNGQGIAASNEYGGTHTNDDNEQEALNTGAADIVEHFLEDFAPHKATATVRIDTDDAGQKDSLDRAKAGDVPKAIEGLRATLAKNPGNAVAQYNLAVLLDATGQYPEALDLFTKAVQAQPKKDFWAEAKGECATRAAAQKALKAEKVEIPAPASPSPAAAK